MRNKSILLFSALIVILFPEAAFAGTDLWCATSDCGSSQTSITDSASSDALIVTQNGSGRAINASTSSTSRSAIFATNSSGYYSIIGDSSSGATSTVSILGKNSDSSGVGVGGTCTGSGCFAGYFSAETNDSGSIGAFGVGFGSSNVGAGGLTDTGIGVAGSATTGVGVEGTATSTSTGNTHAGVYGSNTSGGWAGYFDGPVHVPTNDFCNPTCSSDIRLKKNIEPLKSVLGRILQVRGVTFEWKDPNIGIGRLPGTRTGLVAQEVERVFPSWVGTDGDGFKTLSVESKEGFALTVEAFRELNDRLIASESRNKAQDARLQELEDARRPVIAWNPNWGPVAMGLIIGGAILVNGRRKRDNEKPA